MIGNGDSKGGLMSDRAADFTGSIPSFYNQGLGPIFFAEFADDIARRVAVSAPTRVLKIAAGTGIVTRRLRDLLPPEAHLTATEPEFSQTPDFRAKKPSIRISLSRHAVCSGPVHRHRSGRKEVGW
jgi:hypothetical protein